MEGFCFHLSGKTFWAGALCLSGFIRMSKYHYIIKSFCPCDCVCVSGRGGGSGVHSRGFVWNRFCLFP